MVTGIDTKGDGQKAIIMNINTKHIIAGIAGAAVLLLVYFTILTLLESFSHAVSQFLLIWPWMTALIIGFGIQIGLYSYVRAGFKIKRLQGANAEIAASGGISTGSMLLCCAHHITDVIPILGVSAAAAFLVQYQPLFLLVGVLSNIVGITMMLEIIQKHSLSTGFFRRALTYNMAQVKQLAVFFAVVLFFVGLFITLMPGIGFSTASSASGSPNPASISLATQTSNENSLTIDVTPAYFSINQPVSFTVALNTHSGSLDDDLTKVSVLFDDLGNSYLPTKWDGPGAGGHHKTGILSFPKISPNAKSMTLVMKGVFDVPERTFVWKIA